MATQTLRAADRFPTGTVVAFYYAVQMILGQAPSGTAITTATVAADGSLTASGLPDNAELAAYAQVNGVHVYVRLRTDSLSTITAPRNRGTYTPGAQYFTGDIALNPGGAAPGSGPYVAVQDVPVAPATLDLAQFKLFPSVIWIPVAFPGDLSLITSMVPIPIPRGNGTMTILGMKPACETAPTGQAVIFDVLRKNSATGLVSLFSDNTKRPKINSGSTNGIAVLPDVTTVLTNSTDTLFATILQAGSTIPGANACLQIRMIETG